MLQKYLQKKAKQLKTDGFLSHSLRQTIKSITSVDCNRIQLESVQVACNQLLLAAQKANISQNQDQIRQLLEIVKQLLLQIHFDQIYQVYLIKIRIFLLTIALNRVSPSPKWQEERKVMFFIQTIEQSDLYLLFQEDFYSNLELLYIQAIKINLKLGNPNQTLRLIKQAFQTLKKQIMIISDFANLSCSNKMSKVIQKKKSSLEILFYLEFGAIVSTTFYKDDNDFSNLSNRIADELIPKYQKLFNKIIIKFDLGQLIRRAANFLKNMKQDQQAKQEIFVEETQNKERLSILSQSFTQISSSNLASFKRINNFQNSAQFIQQLERNRRKSVNPRLLNKLTVGIPQRISIRCESDHKISQQASGKPIKSRFSNFVTANSDKKSGQKVKERQLRFCQQISNMILQIMPGSKKDKQVKQYRSRKFSMVVKEELRERERLKKLKIEPRDGQKQNMKISQGTMLKNGVFLAAIQ